MEFCLALGFLLGDEASADEAIKRFKTGMRNQSVPARVAAVSELSREKHEKTAKVLAGLLMADVCDVRAAAATGLAGFTDYKRMVVPALMASLGGPNQKEPKVRAAIMGTLGKMNDDASVPMIFQGFKDDYITVAKAAVMATVDLKRKEAIDQLIELLKDCQKWTKSKQGGGYKDDQGKNGDEKAQTDRVADLQKTILAALQAMTTEKWPSAEEWVVWWGRRKATFEFAADKK
jgi:HEAT repeat protein